LTKRENVCDRFGAPHFGGKNRMLIKEWLFKCQVNLLHTSVVNYVETEPFGGARVRFGEGDESDALEQQLGLAATGKKELSYEQLFIIYRYNLNETPFSLDDKLRPILVFAV
jgi:hypothetical protein